MSRKRKSQFKYTAFIMLPVLLVAAVLAVVLWAQSAKALDSTQWETVRGYINSYFSTEATGGDEAGLIYPKATLMHNLGGNTGTGAVDTSLASYVGEGDDMANKPVLIDNLMNGQTTDVPGTEFRCQWNTAGSCFGQTSIDAVKAQVDAHATAGFSTDIVDYCATSHTASPTTAGWGIIAQTGALQTGGGVPKVYEMWYSRGGWSNTITNPPNGGQATAAPDSAGATVYGQTFPTSPTCSGTDAEVVRCTADWAISSTGGNTGNGVSDIATIAAAGQSIDVRPGSIITMSTANRNLQLPLDTLFSTTSLQKIDPTMTFVVASNTQHGGQAAMGLTMLGYSGIHYATNPANGGYINGGIYRWSSATNGSLFAPSGDALPFLTVASLTAGPGVTVDTSGVACSGACTGPAITGTPSVSGITTTGATISGWTTNKPTTVHVEYGTTNSYGTVANNTVLHADHSGGNGVTLTGLSPYTHYYYRVTDYDSNANASTTQLTGDFTTADGTPPVISNVSPADGATVYTSSPAVSADLSDTQSGINTASVTVAVDGNPLAGCTVTTANVSCATSGLAYGPHTLAISAQDNDGNLATSNTAFNVGDNVAPTFANEQPTGTIANASPTISDDLSDATSGINAAATVVKLDGSDISGTCTKAAGNVSCPTSGLSNASHSVAVTAYDNAGNSATDSWSFTVDTAAPTITTVSPADGSWSATATPVVSMDYTATGTVTGATLAIDTTACAGATWDQTHITCTAPSLGEGSHTVDGTVSVGTHLASHSWSFGVDTFAPEVTNVGPSGDVAGAVTITADVSDATSGVNSGSATASVDGNPVAGCTVNDGHLSCPAGSDLPVGIHNFTGSVADNAGNSSTFGGSFNITKVSYFWTWYDNGSAGSQNWVLMANPGSSAATFDLYIAGILKDPTPGSGLGGVVPGGQVAFDQYPGLVDGPVRVDSMSGPAVTSQRSLWAGNSLEEIPGMAETRLSDHYYWSWYDQKSPGYQNWILVANPDTATDTVTATISFTDQDTGTPVSQTYDIAPGAKVTPQFDGMRGGPVEVKAFVQGGNWNNTGDRRNVIASQRVLSGGGTAFNEVPGIPADELSNRYLWTWYDNKSPGAADWVLVANPNATDVNYTVKVAGSTVVDNAVLHPGEIATPTFDVPIGGPVEVTSTNGNVIASQRVLWGPSFEEKPGIAASNSGGFSSLDSTYNWTWYDNKSPGAADWVLVANPNATDVNVTVKVAGSTVVDSQLLHPGESVTPTFDVPIGGPVQVSSTGGNVIASQRVLWNGYFNEVEGTTLK